MGERGAQQRGNASGAAPRATVLDPISAGGPISASARGQSAELIAGGWGSGGAGSGAQAPSTTPAPAPGGTAPGTPATPPAAPQTFRARNYRLSAAGSGLNMVMMPGIAWRVPQSPVVTFRATVETSDGNAAPADTRAGFVQTLLSSTRSGLYTDSDGRPVGTYTVSRPRSMDQDTSLGPRAPWYNPTLGMSGATVDVGGRDAPWFAPPHYQDSGAATLTSMEGADTFCTWVAVSVAGHTPVLLGWYNWSVSWRARIDGNFNARGGGPRIGAHGEGQGDTSPVLGGTPPNLGAGGTFVRTPQPTPASGSGGTGASGSGP